jgi:hypothetical protein
MSTLEERADLSSVAPPDTPREGIDIKPLALSQELRSNTTKWLLPTYEVFLSVLHVTLTIVFATLGDALVLLVITWAFGKPETQPMFAQKFLEGIKILSIIGASATYAIYLMYSLIQDVQHIRKMIRDGNKK